MQQIAIKYGIMTGIAMALYLFVFHQIDKVYATNPLVSFSSLLLLVVGMVITCRKLQELNNGGLTKQEALKHNFLVAVISGLFFYGFMFILFQFLDPSLNDILVQRGGGKMTFSAVLLGYVLSLLYGFLLAYMVASFMKK